MSLGSKLALGTAQMGLPYGVANTSGQMTPESILAVLRTARAAGMDTLDTAIAYGNSEERLGQAGVPDWKIITKLPALPQNTNPASWVATQVDASLQRLNVNRLEGLLLHHPEHLLQPGGTALWHAMNLEKSRGRVHHIGISIYQPSELDALWPTYQPDLVQAPLKILDQSLILNNWLGRLIENGVVVHTRSAFLQGLLLMPPPQRPAWSHRWGKLFQRWDEWLQHVGCQAESAALAWVFHQPGITRVIVGVDHAAQLQRLVEIINDRAWENLPLADLESFAQSDDALINPSRWPRP